MGAWVLIEPGETLPEDEGREERTSEAVQGSGLKVSRYEILLVLVLILGAVLRYSGLNWDENTHLHPDERFLTMVESSLQFPESLGEYFNTETSPLNPHNAGHGFFVYGTLPIFLVRFLAAIFRMSSYDQVHLLGRATAGTFDLLSIILIYLIGTRLYSRRAGIVAAAFTSVAVLLIQHAHYFVVDTFATTFVLAGFYFAVRVLDEGQIRDYLLFGLALGMSVASKISAAPLAGLVLVAGVIRLLELDQAEEARERRRLIAGVLLAAGVSLLAFRIFQPYAFQGTSFFDVRLNPKWLDNMREIRTLSSGRAEFPPAWQWAGRPRILFSFRNLVLWGLGLPLGVTAWLGWGWALLRILRGEWQRHTLPVLWILVYFLSQAWGFTQAMRYQLPIYPLLALMAAWGLWRAWDRAGGIRRIPAALGRAVIALTGASVFIATAMYAFGFVSIYTRPVTRVAASRWMFRNVPGVVNLVVQGEGGQEFLEPIYMPVELTLGSEAPHMAAFQSGSEGRVVEMLMPHVKDASAGSDPITLQVTLSRDPEGVDVISRGRYDGPLPSASTAQIRIPLDPPLDLEADRMYYATLDLQAGGPVAMRGSVIISETSWDDGLPLRIDGRDAYGGYYTGVNQELYWPDNADDDGDGVADKLERIISTLDQGDYLVITSNRQYGSIARISVRYPLTAAYYRALFDCPEPQSIPRCGARAQPGEVGSPLGYELVQVFESNPRLGPFEISDQLAEEAFTVYDHPKVLIFRKTEEFDSERVRAMLSQVDLSRIENVLPKDAGGGLLAGGGASAGDLMLPAERWEEQRDSGTWSELFPPDRLINRSQILAVVIWWGLISLIGLAMFPWVQVAMGGLSDWGYPLSRTVGLLVLSWGTWMLGSVGVEFRPLSIGVVLLAMLICSGMIGWRDRYRLRTYLRTNWRSMLRVELVASAFFIFFLLVRLGNPDLWHPGRGGEKPMDFSYLNAVLKSTEFPPYDPWYAGGYINYYYYGFVLVGVPVKLLGLNPDVAYNLILPTLYAMLALGAYSVGANLTAGFRRGGDEGPSGKPWFVGITAALGMNLIGNLGTLRLIYDGLKRVGADDQAVAGSLRGIFQALRGGGQVLLGGGSLPYGIGSWYWDPSRAIPPGPGEPGPITEFPYFTFLYADLHAHMINMPLTLAALAWALSWIQRAKRRVRLRWLDSGLTLFTAGLILGALRPTNSWDFPAYWGLGAAALAFGAWLRQRAPWRAVLEAVVGLSLVFGFAWLLYSPFNRWFGQAYTNVRLWEGGRTPLGAYLTVHGIFLFVILSWMAWETWRWLAETPVSALKRLRPYARPIAFGLLGAIVLIVGLAMRGYPVIWVAAPVILWAGVLLVRPRLPVEKRAVLVMSMGAIALTFGVEVVVLQGDIGRMNTVFKFYLQVWTLFSMSAAAGLFWLLRDSGRWQPRVRWAWLILLSVLVASGFLYPLTATPAKIRDRMAREAPHTLDGARFMQHATYADLGQTFPLHEDYAAIQWMRENVEGSPVIVEANAPEYRWGTRYTIYTGLPGVLGWNWHQRQQRAANPAADVAGRVRQITSFYLTTSVQEARSFIEQYAVEYIIVGRLERIYFEQIYPCRVEDPVAGLINCDFAGRPVGMRVPEVSVSECRPMDPGDDPNRLSCPTHGIEKFDAMVADGYLRPAFLDGETVIYEVVR